MTLEPVGRKELYEAIRKNKALQEAFIIEEILPKVEGNHEGDVVLKESFRLILNDGKRQVETYKEKVRQAISNSANGKKLVGYTVPEIIEALEKSGAKHYRFEVQKNLSGGGKAGVAEFHDELLKELKLE